MKYLVPGLVHVLHVSLKVEGFLESLETDLTLQTLRRAAHTLSETFRGRSGLQHAVGATFLQAA